MTQEVDDIKPGAESPQPTTRMELERRKRPPHWLGPGAVKERVAASSWVSIEG
jgi:hypothetical protein